MADILGDGLDTVAVEQNVSIAQIQAKQQGIVAAKQQVSLPATGFVSTINGEDGAVTIQPGTSSAGVAVVVTNGLGTVSIGVTGIGAAGAAKSNIAAASDPGAGDDSSLGYAPFSVWINSFTQIAFLCSDASVGAAVWIQLN